VLPYRRLAHRIRWVATLTVTSASAAACGAGGGSADAATEEPPRVVALVVVDQLRPDLLERCASLWQGGFRTLLEQGYHFTRASHAHAFTETGPGHATLATGTTPAQHGIVGNEWWVSDGEGWREVYGLEDLDAPILGLPSADGRGPRNMARRGIADWIREAHPEARSLSVSRKDRSAIALGETTPGAHVYWLHPASGRFVTSEFYRPEYPEWVVRFNADVMPGVMDDTVWVSAVPPHAAHLTTPDTVAAEGDQVNTAFPHRAWREADDTTLAARNNWVARTPALDSATLELALAGMAALGMGRDPVPDFLAVAFSQADYVGHDYGPLSREQLDNLLRLDRLLGRFLAALDDAAGAGGWVLALSSDHGVLSLPEMLVDGVPAGRRLTEREGDRVREAVERASQDGLGDAELRAIEALDGVAAVYAIAALARGEQPDSFAPLYRASFFPGRIPEMVSTGGLFIRLDSGVIADDKTDRSNHGTPYWYDRHVPLLFLGAGVQSGRSEQPVFTHDVAPTLARLARVQAPDGLDGHALDVGAAGPVAGP
jgi:predicted AlkP superfamily pyrophosphatase or phosphodiesterase